MLQALTRFCKCTVCFLIPVSFTAGVQYIKTTDLLIQAVVVNESDMGIVKC